MRHVVEIAQQQTQCVGAFREFLGDLSLTATKVHDLVCRRVLPELVCRRVVLPELRQRVELKIVSTSSRSWSRLTQPSR